MNIRDVKMWPGEQATLYTYIDTHKGVDRVTICAHGSRYIPASTRAAIFSPYGYMKAHDLSMFLRQNYQIDRIRFIRLLCCHSADGYLSSLAADLSRLLPGKTVKGYAGSVHSNLLPKDVGDIIGKSGPQRFIDLFTEIGHQKLYKIDEHFHSVTFENGRCIKQHYGMVHDNNGNTLATL